MEIVELLKQSAANGASDVFVTAGKAPYCRMHGQIVVLDEPPVAAEKINAFRKEILLPEAETAFKTKGSFDSGLTLDVSTRFRINFLTQQALPAFVARPIPLGEKLDFAELNLPEEIKELAKLDRGLILLSGSTGSGKSTTMSAILNHINKHCHKHIVTIEDPIEFIHKDIKCLVTQREVGSDTSGFSEALRNVVRESPDVIIIGEMRDLDTMQTAITAALTGHLVLSTVHTSDTIQAVERIINHFPEHLRMQAADDLSLALAGVIGQRLLPRKDSKKMIPAVEILKATPHIRNLIAKRDYKTMEEAIKQGREEGMITFDRALCDLYKDGKIELSDGASMATNRSEYLFLIEGMESGIETFRNEFGEGKEDNDQVDMKRLLYAAVANDASDLILSTGVCPSLRYKGELAELDVEPLTPLDTKRLLFSVLTPRQRAVFEDEREIDFALTIGLEDSKGKKSVHRFRVNGFFQRGNVGAALRVIPQDIPGLAELGIPDPIIKLSDKKHGLILVTGPTGHGKSTTMAALIDRINNNRHCHIITIEDPIEYVHSNKKAIVEQREVHADTKSFRAALKYVLRQDPDIILIGEMRDPETIAAALTAAETGHLVIATLHTNNAPDTINRIVDSFPSHQQNQIRLQLSTSLLGVISQRLLLRKDDTGRIAAFEVMIGTPAIKALVRDGKVQQIPSAIEIGRKDGMISMDKALERLCNQDMITKEQMETLSKISSYAETR